MVNVKVAEDAPAAKNCGVMANLASNTYPLSVRRLACAVFESRGPLRIVVEPEMFDRVDWYVARPFAPMATVVEGSLLNGA
jgi:hypothetical protein